MQAAMIGYAVFAGVVFVVLIALALAAGVSAVVRKIRRDKTADSPDRRSW